MGRTAQEKREKFAAQRKKDGQLQSFACMFLAVNLNCLIIQSFGDNIVDMSEKILEGSIIDTGWYGVAALSCFTTAAWTTVSTSIAAVFGQNLTDMNYIEKKRDLEISLLGEHLIQQPR